ncbi:hypothetical protein SRB17_59540 [Streptomyces sp. RB17]|nr:hypothetical protein [Streptomyces sp. RB17]
MTCLTIGVNFLTGYDLHRHLRRRPAPLRLTGRNGSAAAVPAAGLLTRTPSGQQFRCLMLRVFRGELGFGDDVTAFAYQVLIDRKVIFFRRVVCHGWPGFMVIDKETGSLSGSVEPGGDPVADQQIDDGREPVIKDDA